MHQMGILHWTFILLLGLKLAGVATFGWLVVFIPIVLYALYILWALDQYLKLKKKQEEYLTQLQASIGQSPRPVSMFDLLKKDEDKPEPPKVH